MARKAKTKDNAWEKYKVAALLGNVVVLIIGFLLREVWLPDVKRWLTVPKLYFSFGEPDRYVFMGVADGKLYQMGEVKGASSVIEFFNCEGVYAKGMDVTFDVYNESVRDANLIAIEIVIEHYEPTPPPTLSYQWPPKELAPVAYAETPERFVAKISPKPEDFVCQWYLPKSPKNNVWQKAGSPISAMGGKMNILGRFKQGIIKEGEHRQFSGKVYAGEPGFYKVRFRAIYKYDVRSNFVQSDQAFCIVYDPKYESGSVQAEWDASKKPFTPTLTSEGYRETPVGTKEVTPIVTITPGWLPEMPPAGPEIPLLEPNNPGFLPFSP